MLVQQCTYHDMKRKVNLTWEILSELVERAGHDSVSSVESFFHAIAMVYVDVNVKHALMNLSYIHTYIHTYVRTHIYINIAI